MRMWLLVLNFSFLVSLRKRFSRFNVHLVLRHKKRRRFCRVISGAASKMSLTRKINSLNVYLREVEITMLSINHIFIRKYKC